MRPYLYRQYRRRESSRQGGYGREDDFKPIWNKQERSRDQSGRQVLYRFASVTLIEGTIRGRSHIHW
jgi:hypothetical protein